MGREMGATNNERWVACGFGEAVFWGRAWYRVFNHSMRDGLMSNGGLKHERIGVAVC